MEAKKTIIKSRYAKFGTTPPFAPKTKIYGNKEYVAYFGMFDKDAAEKAAKNLMNIPSDPILVKIVKSRARDGSVGAKRVGMLNKIRPYWILYIH
jgi:hypothetical protein